MTLNLMTPNLETELKPRIVVVGVGGAGCNAVNNMINVNLEGVEFVVANTDAQSLTLSRAERRIQLGPNITHGLGAGARPDIGRASAEEAIDAIVDHLQGSHMAFITAGMGGGTGTGAAPVIARIAREHGILTVGVVTRPFQFEGNHRMALAEEGIEELQHFVDTLIVIPNQNLFRVCNDKTTFADAFKLADNVLYSGVRGVTDLMVMPGLINLDFADIRTVMSEMGKAMMGTGEASGERRAIEAAEAAIANPLLDDVSMKGARGVLINITGGLDMTLFEVDEAANRIREEVDPNAHIIFGSTFEEDLDGLMRVSIVATGIEAEASSTLPRPALISLVHDADRQKTEPESNPTPVPVVTAPTQAEGIVAPSVEASADDTSHMPPPAASTAQPRVEPQQPAPAPRAPEPAKPGATASGLAEKPFIAPKPIEPPVESAPRSAMPRRAQPAAKQAEPAHEQPVESDRKRGFSLFGRVTGANPSSRRAAAAAELDRPAPTPKPAAEAAPTSAKAPAPGSAEEEDLLEIPAFLRRQAN